MFLLIRRWIVIVNGLLNIGSHYSVCSYLSLSNLEGLIPLSTSALKVLDFPEIFTCAVPWALFYVFHGLLVKLISTGEAKGANENVLSAKNM